MARWIFTGCVFLFIHSYHAQEKFLELTIAPISNGKALKGFEVVLEPGSDATITVTFKRKKHTLLLSSNKLHTIWVGKKGFYYYPLEIDLRSIPESMQQNGFVQHDLILELTATSEKQPPHQKVLVFESRYARMREKNPEND